MNKIKIIDLLNKIANGEEVPKEIKIKTNWNTIAPYYLENNEYLNKYTGETLIESLKEFSLNDEIKIIEEEKEIEKIELGMVSSNGEYIISIHNEKIQDKINELIDVVNELKRDKEC